MRILNWVQNKLNGKQEKKRCEAGASLARHPCKQEFNNWPQALLSIGTFGNKDLREEPKRDDFSHDLCPSQDLPDFTLEDVKKLQEELTKLLRRKLKSKRKSSEKGEEERANLPLNRFLNCPSSLDFDRTVPRYLRDGFDSNENGGLSTNTEIIFSEAGDLLTNNCSAIQPKSLTFLLKNFFVCRGGFVSGPNLRDPIPESRIDKILRMMIHKKIYPGSSVSTSTKKYLEDKHMEKVQESDKGEERGEDRCKWVKTDSDFIVLEM
ncbi:uncharacterized protein LOC109720914 [Ananas comosus]|uniref:Uncharacterized protein LOC109720914 n=1 Tax=Ananas comosus TaxID=4615 RepID=A0A6P5GD67_ANACO|nr:uncharacterized protein LOC109720914 [Ananas comosus]